MSNPETLPPYRYDARMADDIETRWQAQWRKQGIYHSPNPSGKLSTDQFGLADRPKLFIMDMFPYPSGVGLHVGHPLGFIATDVYARFKRMTGFNVLHTMGFDAFGLPAEEHARQTGEHPRVNTERNIVNMSRQLNRLGLGHDERRSFATTDPDYYRWTQWIFLELFNAWFDDLSQRARPISELIGDFDSKSRSPKGGEDWAQADESERRRILSQYRLAYVDEAPVNWCPGLGTVLSNEEVTAEGRSERGNFAVFQRPLKQWMMRITAYADRLLDDLDLLDWSDSIKTMQRNWIGRSLGAYIDFGPVRVFTTRPDTVYGTTFMVLAPEHPLVDELTADEWPADVDERLSGGFSNPRAAVVAYRERVAQMTDFDRQENKDKTGVFIGTTCPVPVDGREVPIFIADYALMGYGTGAVMGVPGEDQRDWEFAEKYGLDIIRTVEPPSDFVGQAYVGDGPATNSGFLNGMEKAEAIAAIIEWLQDQGLGEGAVNYKLRDWLFSRQRYWGEPFPIVFGDDDLPRALPEEDLPVLLPDLMDWAPRSLDEDSEPEPPLGRVTQWREVELDLGDGEGTKSYRRELNTMPNWAGSCWYYLRYLDPDNDSAMVDRDVERYWMADPGGGVGGVDLYVGGVEHAVLHLLYARFWHKVLYDLGHVSGPEPFKRLINQGYIQAAAYQDNRGAYVPAEEVVGTPQAGFTHNGGEVTRAFGKMGKSLKNAVTPDDMYEAYGADTLRLYEMSMGPIDQDRPWETRSVVGSHRLLQRVWRNLVNEETGELLVTEDEPDEELRRALHKTIDGVAADMEGLRFNTATAKITELNNELTKRDSATPREVADAMVRMLAPLVPHVAEELWQRLGGVGSVTRASFPVADPLLLVDEMIELPVQVNGKLRAKILVSVDASDETVVELALAESNVLAHTDGRKLQKSILVPGRMVNFVV
ncbi:MAG: leucine--tRNA ligase [Acidimicrobiaceae bacterium]|nr:leucine--tRNA ligase [Acidimicrobiaceae bacterium]MYA74541.1 leucine--tRNA ligase [Acidimicrobiaceae bacterium]MYG54218.1 leucine--tRNA ligase [Acidimicrobiaceae bacterium]MYJ97588.1 leucine--tRNA ligase [Acidimicrobiaceae bacterium]